MTQEKFHEVWENIVVSYCKEAFKHSDVNIHFKLFSERRVYNEYQRQRNTLKANYMENPNTHLDCHKIAACLVYAIVKVQPIIINPIDILKCFFKSIVLSNTYALSNEYLAVYSAFSVISSFRKAKSKGGILIPYVEKGYDYTYNLCLDLYLSRKHHKINILTLADVFFLIERISDLESNRSFNKM